MECVSIKDGYYFDIGCGSLVLFEIHPRRTYHKNGPSSFPCPRSKPVKSRAFLLKISLNNCLLYRIGGSLGKDAGHHSTNLVVIIVERKIFLVVVGSYVVEEALTLVAVIDVVLVTVTVVVFNDPWYSVHVRIHRVRYSLTTIRVVRPPELLLHNIPIGRITVDRS